MRKLTFNEMLFSRPSDAWCPVTGRHVGPDVPRVVGDRILKSVGDVPIYYRFPESQGFVKYSNEVGCYDRVGSTHVLTDELDLLEAAIPGVTRQVLDQSYEKRPLELFRFGNRSNEAFIFTCLIHGNESDGIRGSFKAYELMCTHPDFAALRDRYCICMLPCCNPDGTYAGTRNLALYGPHPSGVPTTINLNRVWPWFWTEFVPTEGESKGDAPITCSPESQAMDNWLQSGGGDAPMKIAFAMDQHQTAGDGARYQSRDLCWRDLDEGDWEKIWADWNIYRLATAIQARRVIDDAAPELWINYFRSRWRPHWHSYLATRSAADNGGVACVSMVFESNKVPGQVVSTNLETYKSASDYNLDYLLSCALIMQGGRIVTKPAVLVEHEVGENQVQNTEFADWRNNTDPLLANEYRPSYWNVARGTFDHTASETETRHMEYPGRHLRINPDVLSEMALGHAGPTWNHDCVLGYGETGVAYLVASYDTGGIGFWQWGAHGDPALMFSYMDEVTHQWRLGKCGMLSVSTVQLGNASTAEAASFIEWVGVVGVGVPTTHATHSGALENAATAYDGGDNLYIIGGNISGSTGSRLVLKASSSAWTLTEVGTNLLPSGDWGQAATYCSGGDLDGKIVVIGGQSMTGTLTVRVIDPAGTPSCTTYDITPSDGTPSVITEAAIWYDGTDTIWVYGGINQLTGDQYGNVWTIRWTGSTWRTSMETLIAGTDTDGDPEDYGGEEIWNLRMARWRPCYIVDADTGGTYVALFGGRLQLDDGSFDNNTASYKGFYAHYLDDGILGRPADYNFAYSRYNLHFDVLGYTKAVTSWSMRAPDDTVGDTTAAYVRINNAPGATTVRLTARRLRTHYRHPPRWWIREHDAVDFSMMSPDVPEDEWRAYIRCYRQGQVALLDAPMVQFDTLWPSSWSPYLVTRAVENAAWLDCVDPRFFRISFDWLPAAPFTALSNDTRLFTIGSNTVTVEVWAVNPLPYGREYYRNMTAGSANPCLELRVVVGESTPLVACTIPLFWGVALHDIAFSRFDSPVTIEVWKHQLYGVGMAVRNGWAEGWDCTRGPLAYTMADTIGDINILAGGWWGEPEYLPMNREWRNKYVETSNRTGALLLGETDPCYGQTSYRHAFRYTETFNRADNANLGDNWNIIVDSGDGWNISSNKARCSDFGYEMWTAYPYVRSCQIQANVSAPADCSVGFFARMHWGMGLRGLVNGYGGYLSCTGASTADLVFSYFNVVAGVQQETILGSLEIVYTAGSTVLLEFELNFDEYRIRATDGVTLLGEFEDLYDMSIMVPGAFGILGRTTNNSTYVWMDNLSSIQLVEVQNLK
jgi:hypothetical protein